MRGDVGGTDGGGQTGYGSARYGRTAGMAGTSARWARGRKETRAAQRRTPPPPRPPPSWGLCGGHVGPGMHSLNWLPRTVTWRGAGAGGAKPARPTSVLWLLRGCGWGGSPPSSTLIRGSRYCRQLVRVTEDAGLGAGHNPGERKTPPPPPASPMGAFNNSKRRTTIKLGRLTENTAQHKE